MYESNEVGDPELDVPSVPSVPEVLDGSVEDGSRVDSSDAVGSVEEEAPATPPPP